MPYLHHLTVAPADIDSLGHASNLVYLRWVQEAAIAHSIAVGLDEQAYLSQGQAWVVRRHELDYLRPARVNDALIIETRVATMTAAGSVRKTRILRASDGLCLCRAATDWVYVNLAKERPIRIPDAVRARFALEPDAP